MSDSTQQTQGEGTPQQTATGELKDQSQQATQGQTQDQQQQTQKTDQTDTSLLNQGEKKDGEKKDDTRPGTPEKYADFKLPDGTPEGFELDPAVLGEASTIFKELGLPQEGAQKLVDFYVKKSAEAMEAPFKLWRDTQDTWKNEIKADPEIGGKLDVVRSTVARALDSLGDPKLASEFKAAMDYTGAGNNPAFIRAFFKLAERLVEGSHVTGKGPVPVRQDGTSGRPSAAAAMYPNLSGA
jgi:hypothetical protein